MIDFSFERRPIEGFENYSVDMLGCVWNDKTNKMLNRLVAGAGYLQVALCKDGKAYHRYIHRLVAEAFIEKPDGWAKNWHVHHIDEDQTNNNASNLQWVDPHSHRLAHAKEHGKQVRCRETGFIYDSLADAARQTGICRMAILRNCQGKTRSAHGLYHFEYVNDGDLLEALLKNI